MSLTKIVSFYIKKYLLKKKSKITKIIVYDKQTKISAHVLTKINLSVTFIYLYRHLYQQVKNTKQRFAAVLLKPCMFYDFNFQLSLLLLISLYVCHWVLQIHTK